MVNGVYFRYMLFVVFSVCVCVVTCLFGDVKV